MRALVTLMEPVTKPDHRAVLLSTTAMSRVDGLNTVSFQWSGNGTAGQAEARCRCSDGPNSRISRLSQTKVLGRRSSSRASGRSRSQTEAGLALSSAACTTSAPMPGSRSSSEWQSSGFQRASMTAPGLVRSERVQQVAGPHVAGVVDAAAVGGDHHDEREIGVMGFLPQPRGLAATVESAQARPRRPRSRPARCCSAGSRSCLAVARAARRAGAGFADDRQQRARPVGSSAGCRQLIENLLQGLIKALNIGARVHADRNADLAQLHQQFQPATGLGTAAADRSDVGHVRSRVGRWRPWPSQAPAVGGSNLVGVSGSALVGRGVAAQDRGEVGAARPPDGADRR